nr:MAG TPA: portal protein [Caudoviricetes sp.]
MANRYVPTSRNKITQNFYRYYTADTNNNYSLYQNEAQNVSNGMFYETSLGHLIINQLTTKVVGQGLTPMASPDTKLLGWSPEQLKNFQEQAESLYRLIAHNTGFSWNGKNNFLILQQMAFKMILINGDILLHRGYKKKDGTVYPYLQIISGKMVGNPNGAQDTKNLIGGVELDSNGVEQGYYIMAVDENLNDTFAYKRVSRFNPKTKRKDYDLVHLYAPSADQIRGIPYLMCLRDDILQITKLKDLHLTKALVQSLFTVFIEKSQENPGDESFQDKVRLGLAVGDKDSNPYGNDDSAPDYELGYGSIIEGNPGEKFVPVESNTNADDFATSLKSLLEIIAASAGLSYEEMLNSYNASFSASRATINSSEKLYKTMRDEFSKKVCNPVYEMIVDYGIMAGLIEAPGYFDSELKKRAILTCTWTGATPTQVDPVKEVNAYALAISNGLCTREYASRNLYGLDFDEVAERLRKEQETITTIDEEEDKQAERESQTEEEEEEGDGSKDE